MVAALVFLAACGAAEVGNQGNTTALNTGGGSSSGGSGGSSGSGDSGGSSIPPPMASPSSLMGIPDPGFCVTGSAPPRPASWPTAPTAGYYYVDGSAANRTDSGNTYGYPNLPRATIPSNLPEGSYVEVHGSFNTASTLTVNGGGTPANPVWVRGYDTASRPTMNMPVSIRGTYVFIENMLFTTTDRTLWVSAGSGASTDHVCVRNTEFAGPGVSAGNNAVISVSGSSTYPTTNTVLYHNTIHDFGAYTSGSENDYHGILPGAYAHYVWVLNNEIYHMGGDSIQVGQANYSTAERPNYVYIGGNLFHNDRENAVDIKSASDVVISQNTMYGYGATSSSSGEIVVIHDDPTYVWVMFNDIHDGLYGIITTGATNTWFIGNVVHAIHHSGSSWDGTSLYATGAAVHMRSSTGGAVFNTLYDYDIGLQIASGSSYRVQNNIFAGRAQSTGMDVRVEPTSTTFDYNLLYGNAGQVRIGWGSTSPWTVATLQAQTTQCDHCPATADPLFLNAASNDFRIPSTSPAANNGVLDAALATFTGRYGIALDKDILGNTRSVGPAPDIGAYESDAQ